MSKYHIVGNHMSRLNFIIIFKIIGENVVLHTVLPAKSDSYVNFVYKVIKDLESIDHLCINPIRRIGLIHK